VEECRQCPIFASFTLAFALQLRKKHGKTSVRLRKISEYSIHITKTPTHYKTLTNTVFSLYRAVKTFYLDNNNELLVYGRIIVVSIKNNKKHINVLRGLDVC
jgi:hypothetical protein